MTVLFLQLRSVGGVSLVLLQLQVAFHSGERLAGKATTGHRQWSGESHEAAEHERLNVATLAALCGRGGRIRTGDLMVPNHAR